MTVHLGEGGNKSRLLDLQFSKHIVDNFDHFLDCSRNIFTSCGSFGHIILI